MKILYFLLLSVLFYGCGFDTNLHIPFNGVYADDTPFEVIDLEMTPCLFDTVPLSPRSCCFLDSLLIVGENFNQVTTDFFKIYYGDTLLTSFGKIGSGPDDFEIPFLNSMGKSEHGCFYIAGDKYCSVTIDTATHQTNIHRLPMPDDFFLVNDVLLYSDSAIVVSQTGDYQLLRYNCETKTVDGYNYYDESCWSGKIKKFNLSMQLFLSVCSSNSQYVVIAYRHIKMVDIISLSDMSLRKRIFFRNFDLSQYDVDGNGNIHFDDDATEFFSFCTAFDDHFYVLSWDCNGTQASSGEVLSSIYKISYDGKIIKQYKPNVSISSFAIRGHEIYANVFDFNQKEKIICKGILK